MILGNTPCPDYRVGQKKNKKIKKSQTYTYNPPHHNQFGRSGAERREIPSKPSLETGLMLRA